MANFAPGTHWRDSARQPKFFFIDAKAAFPLILFLLHIDWWTLYLCSAATLFFAAISHFGFEMSVFKRWLKSYAAGTYKIDRPWWRD